MPKLTKTSCLGSGFAARQAQGLVVLYFTDRVWHAVQEEFEGFKDTAEQVAEAKDTELERLLGVNASLRDEITVLNSRQVTEHFLAVRSCCPVSLGTAQQD